MISRGDENLYHQSLSTACQLTLFVHCHIHNPYIPLLEMRNQCTLFAYDQVPLVTFLLLCYSYIVANFSLPSKKATLQGYPNLRSEIRSIS